MPLYRRGDRGPAVAEIRSRLVGLGLLRATDPASADVFDAATDRAVRGFQQSRGLNVDGIVGPDTYRALDEARWQLGHRLLTFVPGHLSIGDDVADLQRRLLDLGFDPGRCDGIYGPRTAGAVRDFQRNVGLGPDGSCGPRTLRALNRLVRAVVGGSPEGMREEERLRQRGGAPAGRTVVVDPGHGGGDRGVALPDIDETEIVEDLAHRLEGRLGVLGVTAYLSRGPDSCPDDRSRAEFANETEADVLISLHVDGSPDGRCHGLATYYYGTPAAPGSTVGRRLAELIQRELVDRTDLLDCRTHPKTWDLLRLTRMPAVRVELGYLTHPADAARLRASEFRDAAAEGLAAAIQRLYVPAELDPMTGQLQIPALTR